MTAAAFTTAAAGYVRGDVNGDSNVNVTDATTLIHQLLTGATSPASADCNQDGLVNITDVTALVELILNAN